jgi:IS1 family transposase
VSIDRPSRFIVAWMFGPRTAALAEAVVQTTRVRTAEQAGIAWISDGWEPYAETIAEAYCDPVPVSTGGRAWTVLHRTPGVRLTQVVKHRRGRRLDHVEVRATFGAPVEQPHTVHVERLNGVLRDRLACLTRKTHAFAKAAGTWDAAVRLVLFEHNWLRPHPALRQPLPAPIGQRRYLRRTPAMLLGLADRPWSWLAFLTTALSHYIRE